MKIEISVQELSDRAQIYDLMVRYCKAIDTSDYNLLDTCFTSDCRIDLSALGGPVDDYPVLRAWLERSLSTLASMQHSISNMDFDINGDKAKVSTMFINTNVYIKPDGTPSVFTVGGHYHDEMSRTTQGWRISFRNETMTYFNGEKPDVQVD